MSQSKLGSGRSKPRSSASTTHEVSSRSGGVSKAPRRQAPPTVNDGQLFAVLVGKVRPEIDQRLEALLDAAMVEVTGYGSAMIELVRASRDLTLRGGKRMRAALVVAGMEAAAPRARREVALQLGVAVELLQSYFLIHDDWMDDDDLRRGGPSVHAQLRKAFGSKHLGDASGILAGDYVLALAQRALSEARLPASRQAAVLAAFARMQVDAVTGQQLDLTGFPDPETTYALKTSSYSVFGPLCVGARAGGGGDSMVRALERYAVPVGIAFQLRDDLLGAFGDIAATGKPLGSDLRSGKNTVLLAQAQARLDADGLRQLRQVVGNTTATEAEVRQALDLIAACGATAEVETRIDKLVAQGLAALRGARLAPEASAMLRSAAYALTARKA